MNLCAALHEAQMMADVAGTPRYVYLHGSAGYHYSATIPTSVYVTIRPHTEETPNMTTQHTPGTWTLDIDDNCLHPWAIVDSSRLIAVAPKMLAWMEKEASRYEGRDSILKDFAPDTYAMLMSLRAIIAEAKGE